MRPLYEFFVRVSREASQQFAPFMVTCVSSDCPRLERVLIVGLESDEEAWAIIEDLEATDDADRLRDSCAVQSVELPEAKFL